VGQTHDLETDGLPLSPNKQQGPAENNYSFEVTVMQALGQKNNNLVFRATVLKTLGRVGSVIIIFY